MRKVVNVNGRNIYVYRKGHENKHLGRSFVKYWKEGKVALPQHALVFGKDNEEAIGSIVNFIKVALRRIKITQG